MATPICGKCHKPVNERAVFAMGRGHHPACFWPNGVPHSWYRNNQPQRASGVAGTRHQTLTPSDADTPEGARQ